MIHQLHIKNFQSHKDTKLDFVEGVNVIVGTTDSGKTALLRALRWLFRNRPTGDEFRSWWGGDTQVEVRLDDGEVMRQKGNENLYYHRGVAYKAFGTDVPEEISKHLNIDEINLQNLLSHTLNYLHYKKHCVNGSYHHRLVSLSDSFELLSSKNLSHSKIH